MRTDNLWKRKPKKETDLPRKGSRDKPNGGYKKFRNEFTVKSGLGDKFYVGMAHRKEKGE